MHIPDGYLDARLCVLLYAASAIFILYAVKRASEKLADEHIPLFTSLAVLIFAAQMIDLPVPGGTTAHFVGGALAGILLGPLGGVLVMLVVLAIQALVFADGGLLSLGANVLNMGVAAPFVGYATYSLFKRLGGRWTALGAFLAGWLGSVTAAFLAGLELGLSTVFVYPAAITVPAMVLYHLGFGFVDGLVTAAVISFASNYRPQLLALPRL
ncbi:MAG: energy-coupling factor ABC transporter permease [Candidatus Nezhaarchaeota archaeon]|nr:energy-coupling factor ABC transporter permease [Candidatus Nezhaarchaeota archaeon]